MPRLHKARLRAMGSVTVLAAFTIIGALREATLAAQSSVSQPAFAVASIKLSPSGPRNKGIRIVGRRLSGTNMTVDDLITYSYQMHPALISGEAPWVKSTLYDIDAEPDIDGQPTDRQWKLMVQKLLVDRFKFSFHTSKRSLSVFTLTVAKGNSTLKPNTTDPTDVPNIGFRLGNLVAENAQMQDFAWLLSGALLDRPVLDQTHLTGRFDFTLAWTPDDSEFVARGIKPPPIDPNKAPPDLITAMRQQLGLKLESKKALADVMVIDHVEQPTPN